MYTAVSRYVGRATVLGPPVGSSREHGLSVERRQTYIFTLDTTYRGMYDAAMTISLPTAVPIETPDFAKTDSKTPAQILRDARRVIEEFGWCQGQYHTPDGRVCLIGAINVADGHSPDSAFRSMAATQALGSLGIILPLWNDEVGRTESEVADLLSGAADKWEATHAQ